MKFRNILFAFFLFELLSGFSSQYLNRLCAQDLQSTTLLLSENANRINGQIVNQSILNALSLGTIKPLNHLEIKVNLQYSFHLKQLSENSSEVFIDIADVKIDGDTYYRSFPVHMALKPDIYTGVSVLYELSKQITTFNYTFQYSNNKPIKILQLELNTSKNATLQSNINGFSFSEYSKEKFLELLSKINQYWSVNSMIDSLISDDTKHESAFQEDPAEMFVFSEKLRKAKIFAVETISMNELQLNSADPAQLIDKVILIDRLILRYSTLYKASISKSQRDELLAKKLSDTYTTSLIGFFAKASTADFRDSDLILKTSQLLFDDDLFQKLELASPVDNKQLASFYLYKNLSRLGDSLFVKSDFSNALNFFHDAKELDSAYGFLNQNGLLNNKVEAAKLGLLKSYLRISTRAVEAGNQMLANLYREKSSKYLQENLSDNLISNLSDQSDDLILSYLKKGNEFISYQRYLDAIQMFEKASSIARSFYSTHFNELITQGFFSAHRAIFLDLVNQAEQYYEAGQMSEANHRLDQALNYRLDHIHLLRTSTEATNLKNKLNTPYLTAQMVPAQFEKFEFHNLTGSSIDGTSEYYSTGLANFQNQEQHKILVLQQLKKAQLKVWGNSLDDAWLIYEEALESRKNFDLDADGDIRKAFEDLDQKIIERICLNNRFRYEDLMDIIKQSITSKSFENLKEPLEEAVGLGVNNQGCGLDVSEAMQLKEFYYPLFQYQHDYGELLSQLYSLGMYQTVEAYLSFDQLSDTYQLNRFGIKHPTLRDFLMKQNNSIITIQAISYFVDKMDVNEIVNYLELLHNQSFTRSQTFDLQQKIATLLAVADSADEISNPEERISIVTGSDERLNDLKNTYLRAVKKLRRRK